MDRGREFLQRSVHHLAEEYLPRLQAALAPLSTEDLWWRPHEGANSVGNLLLHLEGNVRQWILCGVVVRPDHRRRAEEFAARTGDGAGPLFQALETTVREACDLLARLPVERLDEPIRIQGFDTNVLAAVYHVVEHFAWHTGQICYVAKLRAGPSHGIRFYDDAALNAPIGSRTPPDAEKPS